MKQKNPQIITLFVATAALVLGASTAGAQPRHGHHGPDSHYKLRQSSHLYVGIEGTAFGILAQVTDQAGYMGHGGGGGIIVGWRAAPYLSLEGNIGVNYHNESLGQFRQVVILDSLFLATVMVDVKIHFPAKRRLVPYLQAGVGYAYLGAAYDDLYCGGFSCDTTFAQGPAFEVGGGFDWWFTPNISIGARLLYRAMYFNEANYGDTTVRNDNGNFINGLSLGVNATLHLF